MTQLNASIAHIPLPRYMRHLPISDTGYPVPWFCAKVDGKYDIRIADGAKYARAVSKKLCWLCGQTLGHHLAFVIGPMCAVNRITSEPPCHRDCAEYAVAACPFLTKPRMRRNNVDRPDDARNPAGIMIDRNPGVCLIWMTRSYTIFRPHAGNSGMLFRLGKPEALTFYSEGRVATREEIMASISSGMPLLRREAEVDGPAAIDDLEFKYREAMQLLPAA